ncbi:hypothetical protein MMC13_007467 [Lambiella insularis]|nr:hypothetical protein [Lambiella insularis]
MEPPAKRQRVLESHEQLHRKRARNDLRLKSRFESIFEKFGKDFSGIGDEIDFQTGEIVVNNGHVMTMQDEKDPKGLANEEDELAVDAPSSLTPTDRDQREDIISSPSPQKCSSDTEVSCTGLNIAAAIKLEDGTLHNSAVHGELFITRNILSQLSRLGPHIQRSIANVQRSANSSKVVSIETEDLNTDPMWRVPVLLQTSSSSRLDEPSTEQSVEDLQLDSPQRSPSPLGQSLWSLRPPSYSSKRYRHKKLNLEDDIKLQARQSTGELRSRDLKTQSSGRTLSAIQKVCEDLRPSQNSISPMISATTEVLQPYPLGKNPLCSSMSVKASSSVSESLASTPSSRKGPEVMVRDPDLSLSSQDSLHLSKSKNRLAARAQTTYQETRTEKMATPVEIGRAGSRRPLKTRGNNHRKRGTGNPQRTNNRETPGVASLTVMPSPTEPGDNSGLVEHGKAYASAVKVAPENDSGVIRRRAQLKDPVFFTPDVNDLMADKSKTATSARPPQTGNLGYQHQVPKLRERVSPDPSQNELHVSGCPLALDLDCEATGKPRSGHVMVEICSGVLRQGEAQACAPDSPNERNKDHSIKQNVPRRRGSRRILAARSPLGGIRTSSKGLTRSKHSVSENVQQSVECSDGSGKTVTSSQVHRRSRTIYGSLSSSPDPMAGSAEDLYQNVTRPSPMSKVQAKTTGVIRERKSISNQCVRNSVLASCNISLSSIIGESSDDELSIGSTTKGAPQISTPLKPVSARACGAPRYKCDRSLCLTCG